MVNPYSPTLSNGYPLMDMPGMGVQTPQNPAVQQQSGGLLGGLLGNGNMRGNIGGALSAIGAALMVPAHQRGSVMSNAMANQRQEQMQMAKMKAIREQRDQEAQLKQRELEAVAGWLSSNGATPQEMEIAKYDPKVAMEMVKERLSPKDNRTALQKNFEWARQNGFEGTPLEWANKGRPINMPAPPAGYQYEYDEEGRPVRAVPIPGSPQAMEYEQKQREFQAGQDAAKQSQKNELTKAATLKQSLDEARNLLATGTAVTGTLSRVPAMYSGTNAGKFRSVLKQIQSGVALDTMMRLKKASASGATGFGALSERELDILINDLGALDPDTTDPEIIEKTLNNIQRIIDQVTETVPPEELKKMGLYEAFYGGGEQSQPPAGGVIDAQDYFKPNSQMPNGGVMY